MYVRGDSDLRIAIWHYLLSGGGFRAMYDQVRGLLERGHQVEIWCPDTAECDLLPIDSIATVHRFPLEAAGHWLARNTSFLSARRRYKQTCKSLLQLENYLKQCAAEIDRAGFDVVLAHPSTLFYMHPLARYTNTPSVIYLQEIYRFIHEARPSLPWEALQPHLNRWGTLRYWRNFATNMLDVQTDRVVLREECRAAKEWDRILCNSYFSRESIVRAYGIDAHVCYLGVDLTHFSPLDGLHANYLLGLGGLCYAKGAHLAIEALAQIPIAIRPALRWIGNFAAPSYLNYCERLSQEYGVDFSCKVRVTESELITHLQHALALVYPAVLEPFGYAPLEANGCGTPVIAIAEGGIRETVVDGQNGLLVSDRQPESWAHAIMTLIQDTQLRERLGKQAIVWANEQWSIQAATLRLEKELFEVIASGRRKNPPPSVFSA
jgi:glycosyltransferase involved in cell wall biosynthesis